MKTENHARLSVEDLAAVSGGLNEFAHRPIIGDAMMLSAGNHAAASSTGFGGTGAGGSAFGANHDMFALLDLPTSGPGANAASTGSGGTGAGAHSGLGNGLGSGLAHGVDGNPFAGAVSNGAGGLGANGANGAGGPIGNGLIPAGAFGPHGLGPMNAPINGPLANGGAPGYGANGANGGDVSPITGLTASMPNGMPGGLGANGPYNPISVGWAQASTPLGGTSAYGGQGAGMATQSFEIKNWGDPHVNITINGQTMGQIDEAKSLADFQVFNNTVGGATHVSTQTTHQEQVNQSWNKEIDIQAGTWALAAHNQDRDGDVDAVIKDAYGTHEIGVGQSIREMDGTTITNTGDKLIIEQRLQDGGFVKTEIDVNGNEYLDMKTTGQGNAGLGGYVLDKFAQEHQVQANTPVSTTNTVGMQGLVGWRG